ncbi:MAG TPA: alpha/beta fold hydrolase [Thermoleophilaceae bacterium]|jgi:alpha-beta hydrolase superfamily lysophospholipase
MKHPLPQPPEIGTRDGLAYALFAPRGEPTAGIVVHHGAGSAKESHFDFARAAVAHDMAAVAFDARGHGRSEGAFGPGAIDDVLAMCALMRERAPRLALRGSSMGGFMAIQAAAADGDVDAVVAICPAPEDFLLRGLRSDRFEFEADRERLEPWLEGLDLKRAVASLAPRTALLLLHAQADEQIPYTISQELFEAAGEPKRLLVMPGGHHRSIQHDGELQAVSLKFVERSVGADRSVSG